MQESNSKFHISLIEWHKKTSRKIARFIALLISITFLFPYLTWAFEVQTFQGDLVSVLFQHQPIEISKKLGKIDRFSQGHKQLVIHIQDLHCNYEVQRNISKIIDHLAGKYGLKLVGMEGASLPINVTKLSTFPVESVKKEVGDYFVKQGKISGPEFYAATGQYPIHLEGVETAGHYAANRECVSRFLNDESQGYVYDLREALEEIKPGIYPPALIKHDARKTAFQAGELSILKYAVFLSKAALKQGLSLGAYPQVRKYVSKRRNVFSLDMDADQLFAELESLEAWLRQGMYTAKVQRDLDELLHCLEIMEKLLNISAAPQELAEYRAYSGRFRVEHFIKFLSAHNISGEFDPNPEIYALDHYLGLVGDFYELADQRSIDFVENLEKRMKAHDTELAGLVTGGFHTEMILAELRERGIGFISIKPRIRKIDNVNPYFALLRNQQTPLEKLLAQNQKLFGLGPYSPEHKNSTAILPEAKLSKVKRIPSQVLGANLKLWLVKKLVLKGLRKLELKRVYNGEISRYRANYKDIKLQNIDAIRQKGKIFLVSLTVKNERLFALFCPEADQKHLPRPLDSVTINGYTMGFYAHEVPMEVEKALSEDQPGRHRAEIGMTQLLVMVMPGNGIIKYVMAAVPAMKNWTHRAWLAIKPYFARQQQSPILLHPQLMLAQITLLGLVNAISIAFTNRPLDPNVQLAFVGLILATPLLAALESVKVKLTGQLVTPKVEPSSSNLMLKNMDGEPVSGKQPQEIKKNIFFFKPGKADGNAVMTKQLGAKGAYLAEMARLGKPVPPGFTISAEISLSANPAQEIANLEKEIWENIRHLEKETGQTFGDPENPLLVSVRSGAEQPMRGQMKTIKNIGLDTKNIRRQLNRAVLEIMESYNSTPVRAFRERNNIPDTGTGITVQQMVHGDIGEDSGSGVVYTCNPISGEKGIAGVFARGRPGEEVVSGRSENLENVKVLSQDKRLFRAYQDLQKHAQFLKEHFQENQEIEYVIENGKLYLLQTRSAEDTLSPVAMIHSLLDRITTNIIYEEEVAAKISLADLELMRDTLKAPRLPKDVTNHIGEGKPAAVGIGTGYAAFSLEKAQELMDQGKDVILVLKQSGVKDEETIDNPRCVGVLESSNNPYSHASALKRQKKNMEPCVVGINFEIGRDQKAQYMQVRIGTDVHRINEGDQITVDGHTGRIYEGKIQTTMPVFNDKTERLYQNVEKWIKAQYLRRLEDKILLKQTITQWLKTPDMEIEGSFEIREALKRIHDFHPEFMNANNMPVLTTALKFILSVEEIPEINFSDPNVDMDFLNFLQIIFGDLSNEQGAHLMLLLAEIAPESLSKLIYQNPYRHWSLQEFLTKLGLEKPGNLSMAFDTVIEKVNVGVLKSRELSNYKNKTKFLFAYLLIDLPPKIYEEVVKNISGRTLARCVSEFYLAKDDNDFGRTVDKIDDRINTIKIVLADWQIREFGKYNNFWKEVKETNLQRADTWLSDALKDAGIVQVRKAKSPALAILPMYRDQVIKDGKIVWKEAFKALFYEKLWLLPIIGLTIWSFWFTGVPQFGHELIFITILKLTVPLFGSALQAVLFGLAHYQEVSEEKIPQVIVYDAKLVAFRETAMTGKHFFQIAGVFFRMALLVIGGIIVGGAGLLGLSSGLGMAAGAAIGFVLAYGWHLLWDFSLTKKFPGLAAAMIFPKGIKQNQAWSQVEIESQAGLIIQQIKAGTPVAWQAVKAADLQTRTKLAMACLRQDISKTFENIENFKLDALKLPLHAQVMAHDINDLVYVMFGKITILLEKIKDKSKNTDKLKEISNSFASNSRQFIANYNLIAQSFNNTVKMLDEYNNIDIDMEKQLKKYFRIPSGDMGKSEELQELLLKINKKGKLNKEMLARWKQTTLLYGFMEMTKFMAQMNTDASVLLDLAKSDNSLAEDVRANYLKIRLLRDIFSEKNIFNFGEEQTVDLRIVCLLAKYYLEESEEKITVKIEAEPDFIKQPRPIVGNYGQIIFDLLANLVKNAKNAIHGQFDEGIAVEEKNLTFAEKIAVERKNLAEIIEAMSRDLSKKPSGGHVEIIFKNNGAVFVKDDGPGFPEEILADQGKKYRELGGGTTRQFGLGIGGFVADQIMKKFKGSIEISNREDPETSEIIGARVECSFTEPEPGGRRYVRDEKSEKKIREMFRKKSGYAWLNSARSGVKDIKSWHQISKMVAKLARAWNARQKDSGAPRDKGPGSLDRMQARRIIREIEQVIAEHRQNIEKLFAANPDDGWSDDLQKKVRQVGEDVQKVIEERINEIKNKYPHVFQGFFLERMLFILLQRYNRAASKHSSRVGDLARDMAAASEEKYTYKQLAEFLWAGRLHDIGKILIPESVHNKKGKLTDKERALMRMHDVLGMRIVEAFGGHFKYMYPALWHHKTSQDLPGNVSQSENGVEIQQAVKIADCFDAACAKRPYKGPEFIGEVMAKLREDFALSPKWLKVLERVRGGWQSKFTNGAKVILHTALTHARTALESPTLLSLLITALAAVIAAVAGEYQVVQVFQGISLPAEATAFAWPETASLKVPVWEAFAMLISGIRPVVNTIVVPPVERSERIRKKTEKPKPPKGKSKKKKPEESNKKPEEPGEKGNNIDTYASEIISEAHPKRANEPLFAVSPKERFTQNLMISLLFNPGHLKGLFSLDGISAVLRVGIALVKLVIMLTVGQGINRPGEAFKFNASDPALAKLQRKNWLPDKLAADFARLYGLEIKAVSIRPLSQLAGKRNSWISLLNLGSFYQKTGEAGKPTLYIADNILKVFLNQPKGGKWQQWMWSGNRTLLGLLMRHHSLQYAANNNIDLLRYRFMASTELGVWMKGILSASKTQPHGMESVAHRLGQSMNPLWQTVGLAAIMLLVFVYPAGANDFIPLEYKAELLAGLQKYSLEILALVSTTALGIMKVVSQKKPIFKKTAPNRIIKAGRSNTTPDKIVMEKICKYDGTPEEIEKKYLFSEEEQETLPEEEKKKIIAEEMEKYRKAFIMLEEELSQLAANKDKKAEGTFNACWAFENTIINNNYVEDYIRAKGLKASHILCSEEFWEELKKAGKYRITGPKSKECTDFATRIANKLEKPEEKMPAMPEKEKFILLVRNPQPHTMVKIILEKKDQISAIIWEGVFESKHWPDIAVVFKIPVMGALNQADIYDQVETDDMAIVDSAEKEIVLNVTPAIRETYIIKSLQKQAIEEALAPNASQPAVSQDGQEINISATVGPFPAKTEIKAINKIAGGNVGLFRTEGLYQTENPSENDLCDGFLSMAKQLKGMLSVRALDRNPKDKDDDVFAGQEVFGIEFLLGNSEGRAAYKTQCRAILRAYAESKKKNLRFFVPMIKIATEVEKALAVFKEAKQELIREGVVAEKDVKNIQFGIMLETKEAVANRKQILDIQALDFISIGTRDLAESINPNNHMSVEYIAAIKKIITEASLKNKEASVCGAYAADKSLITAICSGEKIPRFAMRLPNIPSRKAFFRAMDISKLQKMNLSDSSDREEQVKEINRKVIEIITRQKNYLDALTRRYIQQGIKLAVKADFDSKADRSLRSVKVGTITPYMELPEESTLGRLGANYTFMNLVGRYLVDSLGCRAVNKNPLNEFIYRIIQLRTAVGILSRDLANRFVIAAAEGSRKGRPHIPVGTELGFGSELIEVLSLGLEEAGGITDPEKKGTLVASAYAEEGTFLSLHDSYMFQITADTSMQSVDLPGILKTARERTGDNSIDQVFVAQKILEEYDKCGNHDPPRVRVLFRERHCDLLQTLAQEMGIQETYEQMEQALKKGHGYCELPGKKGTLILKENDDWSGALALGKQEGVNINVGAGGYPQALMSAVLIKKLGGSLAGVLVPQNMKKFTGHERRMYARFGIKEKEIKEIYTQDTLVRSMPEDIACTIGVIREYVLDGKKIPGPYLDKQGYLFAHELWVGKGQVHNVPLHYETEIVALLDEKEQGRTTVGLLCDLARAYTRFGEYAKAKAQFDDLPPNISAPDQAKIDTLRHYMEGRRIIVEENGAPKAVNLKAITEFEQALAIITKAGLNDLEADLELNLRIRRIYFWLRIEAAKIGDMRKAYQYSEKALQYSENDFETRARHNTLRLQKLIAEYDQKVDEFWEKSEQEPKLAQRLGFAYDVYKKYLQNPDVQEYGKWLAAKERGGNLWTALLYAAVLSENDFADQAKVMGYLYGDKSARAAGELVGERTKEEVVTDFVALITAARKTPGFGAIKNMDSKRASLATQADRTRARENIRIAEEILATRAQFILEEMAQICQAKAEISLALGNREGARQYLEEMIGHNKLVFDTSATEGLRPVQKLFDIADNYYGLYKEFGDTKYRKAAQESYELLFDREKFAQRCQEIYNEKETEQLWDVMDLIKSVLVGRAQNRLAEVLRLQTYANINELDLKVSRVVGDGIYDLIDEMKSAIKRHDSRIAIEGNQDFPFDKNLRQRIATQFTGNALVIYCFKNLGAKPEEFIVSIRNNEGEAIGHAIIRRDNGKSRLCQFRFVIYPPYGTKGYSRNALYMLMKMMLIPGMLYEKTRINKITFQNIHLNKPDSKWGKIKEFLMKEGFIEIGAAGMRFDVPEVFKAQPRKGIMPKGKKTTENKKTILSIGVMAVLTGVLLKLFFMFTGLEMGSGAGAGIEMALFPAFFLRLPPVRFFQLWRLKRIQHKLKSSLPSDVIANSGLHRVCMKLTNDASEFSQIEFGKIIYKYMRKNKDNYYDWIYLSEMMRHMNFSKKEKFAFGDKPESPFADIKKPRQLFLFQQWISRPSDFGAWEDILPKYFIINKELKKQIFRRQRKSSLPGAA